MAAVATTAANVGVASAMCKLTNLVGGAALQGGQPVYQDSSGLAQLCTSADTTHGQFLGIAIPRMNNGYACGVGQACVVCYEGPIEGFTLSGVAYGSLLYVADDGTFATTAGTKTVPVGKVLATSDKDSSGNYKKVLYVFAPWNTLVS
jgi:hypothetical protein